MAVVVSYHGKPADGLVLSVDKTGKRSAVGDNWPNRVHHGFLLLIIHQQKRLCNSRLRPRHEPW